jgi:hypothetical protein
VSVIATYIRIDSDQLSALRGKPDWLNLLYTGAVPGAQVIDVDKACDGIVWLLSRVSVAPPPPVEGGGFVLRKSFAPLLQGVGGSKEPQLKAPYGPASAISPPQVIELSNWLAVVNADELRRRYDPDAMASDDVYPEIWLDEGAAAFEDYLLPQFTQLRAFLAEAARASQVVLVCFS